MGASCRSEVARWRTTFLLLSAPAAHFAVCRIVATTVLIACIALSDGLASAQPAGRPPANARTIDVPYRRLAEGVFMRPAFEAIAPSREYRVLVWGVLVAPGPAPRRLALPGAAILIVRSGQGVAVIGGTRVPLALGTASQAPEGARIEIANDTRDQPLSLKVIVIQPL